MWGRASEDPTRLIRADRRAPSSGCEPSHLRCEVLLKLTNLVLNRTAQSVSNVDVLAANNEFHEHPILSIKVFVSFSNVVLFYHIVSVLSIKFLLIV